MSDKEVAPLDPRGLGVAASMINLIGGWDTHLEILAAKLSGARTRGFWKRLTALKVEYQVRFYDAAAGRVA